MEKYSPEEIADITTREKKCLAFLQENYLTPASVIQKVAIGDDMFVDKVVPFLQDFKYDKTKPVSEDKNPIGTE